MQAWLIVRRRYADLAFSGEGARRFGGRWNSPGTSVVYTAEHASLAVLEVLAHFQSSALLSSYVLFQIEFQESLVETVPAEHLPAGWRRSPAPASLQAFGDQWAAGSRSAVLQVPSALVPMEWVFVLNPGHRDFTSIEIREPQPFVMDPRLAEG